MAIQPIIRLGLDQVESLVKRQQVGTVQPIASEKLEVVLRSAQNELQAYQQSITMDKRISLIAFKASLITGAVALAGISSIPFAITSALAGVYFASSLCGQGHSSRYIKAIETLVFKSSEARVGCLAYQKREYQITMIRPNQRQTFSPQFVSKTVVTQGGKIGSGQWIIFEDTKGYEAVKDA